MGRARPEDPPREHPPREVCDVSALACTDTAAMDVDALREENRRLKELVVQLSKIVAKNVVDRG